MFLVPTKKLGAHEFFRSLAFNPRIFHFPIADFTTLFCYHTEVMMASCTPPSCYTTAYKALFAEFFRPLSGKQEKLLVLGNSFCDQKVLVECFCLPSHTYSLRFSLESCQSQVYTELFYRRLTLTGFSPFAIGLLFALLLVFQQKLHSCSWF